jgi:hypothetical protein
MTEQVLISGTLSHFLHMECLHLDFPMAQMASVGNATSVELPEL